MIFNNFKIVSTYFFKKKKNENKIHKQKSMSIKEKKKLRKCFKLD
jgi:hypothetical protein